MKEKTWYIWLSILGYMFLWNDTARRILCSSNVDYGNNYSKTTLWVKAVGQAFFSWGICLMLPMAPLLILHELFGDIHPGIPVVINCAELAWLYGMGVYITYRHIVWRRNNIQHLIK
jgi:hypothetical protein